MTISAAIIVKNEEKIMERCLGCVSLFADEIIVVDTGSTDKTKEIAAAHPKVKLFDSEHFDKDTEIADFRFNIAKNEAIDKCTGDWVIWWDADDFIDQDNANKIRDVANNERRVSLYTLGMVYGGMEFEHCRLFSNGQGIRFNPVHSCHEYLDALGHPNFRRKDIIIQHLPGEKPMASAPRNLLILEKDHFDRGVQDPRTLFYLASAYKEVGRFDDALPMYDKYLEVASWAEERFFARYYKAQCFVFTEKWADARNECFKSLLEDFRFAEPYSLLGDLAMREGDFARARHWFGMAMNTPYPEDSKLFVVRNHYSEYPKARLQACDENLNIPDKVVAVGKSPGEMFEIKEKKVVEPENTRKFRLPDNREKAALAVAALSTSVREKVRVEVVSDDSWVKDMVSSVDGLSLGEGDAEEMEIPDNLKGKHLVDWYCRSVGVLPNGWGPMSVSEKGKGSDVVVCFGERWGQNKWRQLFDGIEATKVVANESEGFGEVAQKLSTAKFAVCEQGWIQHLAEAMNIPCVVFWDEGNPETQGWPGQENIVMPNGSLESLEVKAASSIVKGRIENGD